MYSLCPSFCIVICLYIVIKIFRGLGLSPYLLSILYQMYIYLSIQKYDFIV
nr:MAG TPA: hypothetical protein [Caudoviricetes sp.]